MTVFEAMGPEYTATVKRLASENKVAIPEVIARLVGHVLTSDGSAETIKDLLSDAPHSQRGRKALDPETKAARAAVRAVKGQNTEDSVKALQAAIDLLRKA